MRLREIRDDSVHRCMQRVQRMGRESPASTPYIIIMRADEKHSQVELRRPLLPWATPAAGDVLAPGLSDETPLAPGLSDESPLLGSAAPRLLTSARSASDLKRHGRHGYGDEMLQWLVVGGGCGREPGLGLQFG